MEKRKRIVSKWQYVGQTGKRAVLGTAGCVGVFVGLLSISLFIVFMTLFLQEGPKVGNVGLFLLMFFGGLGYAAYLFIRAGYKALHKAEQMEAIAPLTRRNLEQLPADESLVRGAANPAAAQASEAEAPSEQLLRPGRRE